MKRLVLLLAVAFPLLAEAELRPRFLKSVTPEMREIQKKATDLIMGNIEPPTDWLLQEHQSLFQNEDVVNKFLKHYDAGLLAKDKQFSIRDPAIKEETISAFELLFYAKDFNCVYLVASWLYGEMNYEQYTYALAVALIHRQDIVVKLPPWTEVFPNYFVPKTVLELLKSSALNDGGDSDEEQTVKWSNAKCFFADDPALAMMYYNWQLEFPTWLEPAKYGLPDWEKRAELYYAYHYQILNAFHIYAYTSLGEGFRKDWNDVSVWNWLNLQFGYADALVNSANKPIIQKTVPADHTDPEVEAADKKFLPSDEAHGPHSQILKRLEDASIVEKVATVFNMTGSIDPDFFGCYYDTLVNFLAKYGSNPEKDGGNLAGYPITALKDPQYYSVLDRITFPMIMPNEKAMIKTRSMDGIKFESVEVNEVKTKYKTYDIDVSKYVNKLAPRGQYKARTKVVDHTPFVVTMKIDNTLEKTQDITVRLLLSVAGNLTRHFAPWTIAMRTNSWLGITMEIDRFMITAQPGKQTVVRDLKSSPIFTTEEGDDILCGIPNRLILPRGTPQGTKVTLMASMDRYNRPASGPVPTHEEEYLRKSILCGSRLVDDGLPLGHPNWNDGHDINHILKGQFVIKEFTVGFEEDSDESV